MAVMDEQKVREVTFRRREMEILCLLAQWNTNEEIAQKLGLSIPTVKNTIGIIRRLTNTPSRTQLIRYAIERGFDKMEVAI